MQLWEVEGNPTQIFQFAGCGLQTVANVDAQFLAHRLNHAVHLGLEVGGVVNDIEVGMAHPGSCRLVVEFPGQIDALRAAGMVLQRIKGK